MKSEKGVTLVAVVVYVLVPTALISGIALLSSYFFSNMALIKEQTKDSNLYNHKFKARCKSALVLFLIILYFHSVGPYPVKVVKIPLILNKKVNH